MIRLTREYRFYLRPNALYQRGPNSWGGAEGSVTVAPYLTLRAAVSGEADPITGYLINIQAIDRAIADVIAERIATLSFEKLSYIQILRQSEAIKEKLPSHIQLDAVELVVSPFLSLTLRREQPMVVLLTEQFEFSAAHRLHCDQLSESENREIFGKCNNPAGHGHNYVVAVSVKLNSEKEKEFFLEEFERQVKKTIIDRFDHKHLNVDVAEFRELNPTVENIAAVIWELLENEFPENQLDNIRVYETPKTWADFRK